MKMSGMQELANRLLLHSVNQLSAKYPIHRNQIPLFIAWAPLAIPSCWEGSEYNGIQYVGMYRSGSVNSVVEQTESNMDD